jgi:glucose/arabinose dehydrogenase
MMTFQPQVFAMESVPVAVKPDVAMQSFNTRLVTEKLNSAWSLNLAPNKDLFVSERDGTVAVLSANKEIKRYTLPINDMYRKGQGGFLDIAFHPDFMTNAWVYLSYAAGSDDANGLKVVRFKLPSAGQTVSLVEEVFMQDDLRDTPVHYGGRLVFLDDKSLLVSTGDGFDYREKAQVLSSQLGKILRMSDTGKALEDNPFYDEGKPEQQYVYSLGHRNPQALLQTPSKQVLSNEHGPDGGDEINIIEAGLNYGWPIITNGKDYSGALISPLTEHEGMEQPAYDWTPSIAPSSMIFYSGDKYPSLQNSLIIGSLKFKNISVLSYADGQIGTEQIILKDFGHRIRDISLDAEGNILILTDGEPARIFALE